MSKDIKKANRKFSFVYILFFLSSIAILIVAMIFSFFIKDIEKERIDSIQNHLLVAAQRASTYLTVEELDLFHTAEDMERPEWEEIRTKLQRFAEETSVLYVYYWRYDGDNHIQYIIDNDEDEEYMVTPAMFFELDSDEISGEAALKIEAGESWVTELGVYTSSWDGLLTAVVPVFNNDGTVYCGAGVDISDEIFITMRKNIRIIEIVMIISLFVSFLSGFLGMRSYNKKAIQSASDSLSKSRFLSSMSHEIRTPMNAILGIAEIQLQDNRHREETVQAFRRIYESGDLLLNIINDILDLSKIEAGKLELSPTLYELPNLINDTAQLNRLWFDSKSLRFIVNVDKDAPYTLFGDEYRIKQILNNLLSNAYKYTEAGEIQMSVSVELIENSDTVTLILQVSDTGQGMTPSQLKKLFDAYSRFNVEENRNVMGAGLGMNITKHLVDMMKGVISVESEAGKGTTVTVRLPQKSCGARVCGVDIAEELRTFNFRNNLISRMEKIEHKQMLNGKVLIVDDVSINLYVAQGMMLPYGLHIETVNSGIEAIEKIKNNEEFDIIFMDHMMPQMDGIEATKLIREWEAEQNDCTSFAAGETRSNNCDMLETSLQKRKHITIVALTANAVLGQEEMFLANGFDDFIAKPIDSSKLDQVLKRFIKDDNSIENTEVIKTTMDSSKAKKIFVLDAEKTITVLKELSAKWSVRPDSLNDEELELYIVTVHGIKSALASVGQKELSAAAYKLEQAGKNKNFGLIAGDTPVLIEALLSLIENFKTPESDENIKMSQEDKEFLHKKLGEIKTACEKFNVKAAKKALDDLKQKTWPHRVDNICDEISVALLCGEFKKAADAVEGFI